jgi:molecular chaperone GrpE
MSKKNVKPAPVADERPPEVAAPPEGAAAESPAPPEDELVALRRELGELRDQNLRLMAELQNQQKRVQRERLAAQRYAEAGLARELLAVLDDLQRAHEAARTTPEASALAEGLGLVVERFTKVLRDHHVVPIDAVGRPFDPTFHEAVLQMPSQEQPAGTVLQEVAPGYVMHERVLRPSRVIVSGGPSTTNPAEGDGQEP